MTVADLKATIRRELDPDRLSSGDAIRDAKDGIEALVLRTWREHLKALPQDDQAQEFFQTFALIPQCVAQCVQVVRERQAMKESWG